MPRTPPRPGSKAARAEARRRRARRRQLLVGGGVAALALVAVVGIVAGLSSGAPAPTGTTTPAGWDLPELDGDGRVTLAQFSGSPTVATFFAAWCDVCVWELPEFAAVEADVRDQVDFVGIDMMDNGTGLPLATRSGITHWPLARDVGGIDGRGLATAFGARGSPMTVLYDADGTVQQVIRGGITGDQLRQLLGELFGVG